MILINGCATLNFYTQAVTGQMRILSKRQPIDEVIRDSSTDETVRRKLELVLSVREFARNQLDMPVEDAYATYVETGKSHVVWNIFAAPEFSLEMKKFCYPIAGCVTYKGYFDEEDAWRAARKIQQDGHDVFVGGVAAYSTVGWFADPVLDTFLARSDTRLAALLFHELAHRAVYLRGDTNFNEGFATTIERHALKQWLAHLDDVDDRKIGKANVRNREAFEDYAASERRRQQVIALILDTRDKLADLYGRDMDEPVMRQEKRAHIEALRRDYEALKDTWAGPAEFETWMAGDINNAALGAIGAYQDLVPAFEALLARESFDIPAFIQVCRKLASMDKPARERELRLAVKANRG